MYQAGHQEIQIQRQTQRHGDIKTQHGHKDTAWTQRHSRDTKTQQGHKDTRTQRHRETKTQEGHKDTDIVMNFIFNCILLYSKWDRVMTGWSLLTI